MKFFSITWALLISPVLDRGFLCYFLVLIQEFMGLFDPAFMYFASMIVVQVVVLFHLVVESVHQ
jgi:hypothetical protein